MECNININRMNCTCTYEPCSRKGNCCNCIAYHLKFDELPACVFPEDIERTFNRSFSRFADFISNGK
jgi:hypothetical protein